MRYFKLRGTLDNWSSWVSPVDEPFVLNLKYDDCKQSEIFPDIIENMTYTIGEEMLKYNMKSWN